MEYRSSRNESRGADKQYIKRGCLVLEDYLLFSLYSYSCILIQLTTGILILAWLLGPNFQQVVLFRISHFTFQFHQSPTCQSTLLCVPTDCTWYWIFFFPSTGCKKFSKPWSVSSWVYLAPNHHGIRIHDDCVDIPIQHTVFDLSQCTYRSPYDDPTWDNNCTL